MVLGAVRLAYVLVLAGQPLLGTGGFGAFLGVAAPVEALRRRVA